MMLSVENFLNRRLVIPDLHLPLQLPPLAVRNLLCAT